MAEETFFGWYAGAWYERQSEEEPMNPPPPIARPDLERIRRGVHSNVEGDQLVAYVEHLEQRVERLEAWMKKVRHTEHCLRQPHFFAGKLTTEPCNCGWADALGVPR